MHDVKRLRGPGLALLPVLVAALFLGAEAGRSGIGAVEALHTSYWRIYSPVTSNQWVTSPTRYHNGCSETSLYDSTAFDNGTCGSALGGDYSADIAAGSGCCAFIDVNPNSSVTYRIRAGAIGSFTPSGCWSAAPNYQYYYIDRLSGSNWITVGWIVLGHTTNFRYNNGTVIGSGTGRLTFIVADVGSSSCPHIHMEVYNNTDWAVAYDWDGPSNSNDSSLGPACVTSGTEGNPTTCNAWIASSWIFGRVGGTRSSFSELNNPNYNASPDF